MKSRKIITGFTKYSDKNLAPVAQNIVKMMTDNANFPNPFPEVKAVAAVLKTFNEAVKDCLNGTAEQTAYKNQVKDDLMKNLRNLGNYVNAVAEGDLVKLDSSGFPLAAVPHSVGILPAPLSVNLADGESHGEITVKISSVPKASGYLVLYAESPAPADDKQWISQVFSKSKGTLTGLTGGTKYTVKAAAMSSGAETADHYNFTEPVERYAQ